jgi:hypothetical protein
MKKLFLILTLAISLSASAQARRDTLPPITDSTALFSVRDVNEFNELMQSKFTIRELGTYQELLQWWEKRMQMRIAAYKSPQLKSTPKK